MRAVLARIMMFGCVLALPQYQMHMIMVSNTPMEKLVFKKAQYQP